MAKPPSPFAKAITGIILQFVVYGLLVYTWYIYVFRICGKLLTKKKNMVIRWNKANAY